MHWPIKSLASGLPARKWLPRDHHPWQFGSNVHVFNHPAMQLRQQAVLVFFSVKKMELSSRKDGWQKKRIYNSLSRIRGHHSAYLASFQTQRWG